MSIRRLWTLVIASMIVVGALLQTVANYQIDLYGAQRAAYEWLRGARRNGPKAYDAELLAGLSLDARALAGDPQVAAALARRAWADVDVVVRATWADRHPQEQWLAIEDGVAHGGLEACHGRELAALLGSRTSGLAVCGRVPILLATHERAGVDGVQVYAVRAIDDDYATALRQVSGAEVAIIAPWGDVATSLRNLHGEALPLGLEPAGFERIRSAAEEYFGPEALSVPSYRGYYNGSDPYHVGASSFDAYVLAAPLAADDPNVPVTIVFIAPRDILDMGALYSSLMLGACAAVITALLVLGTGILVGRVTRPLARLGRIATKIGAGDTHARVGEVGGGREIEAFASTFDDMVDRLGDLRRQQAAAVGAAEAHAKETSDALARLRAAHEELHHTHVTLRKTQEKLIDASRTAGMAEVATNVLHNVGNVLNTVNVAADVAQRHLRGSKVGTLERTVAMLPTERAELVRFFAEDARAAQIPRLLALVTEALRAQDRGIATELHVLTRSIDHIKNIVRSQQQMAMSRGGTELVAPCEVLDTAIALGGAADGPTIDVVRAYDPVEPRQLDRHRTLQILMNLLGNARHAVREGGCAAPRIVLRLSADQEAIRIEVTDNGVGFDPDLGRRLFEHGFTTKADGHGFGLHSSANAAVEMGGALSAHSDGGGRGATFVLRIPALPVRVAA